MNSFIKGIIADISNESVEKEIEFEIYAKGVDLKSLSEKSFEIEDQVQFSFFHNANENTTSSSGHRVRYSHTLNPSTGEVEEKYVYTIKIRDNEGHTNEINHVVTQNDFNHFKLAADNCFSKKRIKVPAEVAGNHLVMEFDTNENSPWVKIDLEIPATLESLTNEEIMDAVYKIIEVEEFFVIRPSDRKENPSLVERGTKIVEEFFIKKGPFTINS